MFAGKVSEARPVAFSKLYKAERKLGVGLMLGIPTGLSLKYHLTSTLAVDLGAGAYIAYRDRTGFHAHLDLLWHPFVAVEGQSFMAPMYIGLGTRLLVHDVAHVGVRVPVGISFDFANTPIDIFLEGAFVYDVSIGEGGSGPVDINAMLGLRYYLF